MIRRIIGILCGGAITGIGMVLIEVYNDAQFRDMATNLIGSILIMSGYNVFEIIAKKKK